MLSKINRIVKDAIITRNTLFKEFKEKILKQTPGFEPTHNVKSDYQHDALTISDTRANRFSGPKIGEVIK